MGYQKGVHVREYYQAAELDQVKLGTGTTVTVQGKEIALFNVDGQIYAIDDACLHQGLSLGSSKLEGKVVTCRAHGWRFDVTTGSTMHVPGFGVSAYPVKIEDDKVLVAVDSPLVPLVKL
jgi:nitrite reductase/ring-hydroxylating ferredoxin subunit